MEGPEMFHYAGGVLHSKQHMKEEKLYHMLRTSIIVGRLYWPNSSKELLI